MPKGGAGAEELRRPHAAPLYDATAPLLRIRTGSGPFTLEPRMPEILDAIRENGLALVALVLVSGALVMVVRVFYRELQDRRVQAESDARAAHALNDKLADAFKIALDELRKR